MKKILAFSIIFTFALASCSSNPAITNENAGANDKTPTTTAIQNHLSFKINGIEWQADSEIFGAFHPKGYNKAILISGSKGGNDKNEQAFSIILYNTSGPGVFDITNGNKDNNVIQLANMSPANFMYGSMMGFNIKINVTAASENPTHIEATFEGELTGNAGDELKITEGKFQYHE